jgi:hypothetical protein
LCSTGTLKTIRLSRPITPILSTGRPQSLEVPRAVTLGRPVEETADAHAAVQGGAIGKVLIDVS